MLEIVTVSLFYLSFLNFITLRRVDLAIGWATNLPTVKILHSVCFLILLLISGNLQNGRLCDENARGWVHPWEENRQDFPTNGQKQRRQTVPRRVHRGSKKWPFHRPITPMWPPANTVIWPPLLFLFLLHYYSYCNYMNSYILHYITTTLLFLRRKKTLNFLQLFSVNSFITCFIITIRRVCKMCFMLFDKIFIKMIIELHDITVTDYTRHNN